MCLKMTIPQYLTSLFYTCLTPQPNTYIKTFCKDQEVCHEHLGVQGPFSDDVVSQFSRCNGYTTITLPVNEILTSRTS